MQTPAQLYDLYKNDWQEIDGVFAATFLPRGGGSASGVKCLEADITRSEVVRFAAEAGASGYDVVFFTWDTTYGAAGDPRPDENDLIQVGSVKYRITKTTTTVFGTQIVLFLTRLRV